MYSTVLEEDHIRVNAIRIILKHFHWWNPWATICDIRAIINCTSFPPEHINRRCVVKEILNA